MVGGKRKSRRGSERVKMLSSRQVLQLKVVAMPTGDETVEKEGIGEPKEGWKGLMMRGLG